MKSRFNLQIDLHLVTIIFIAVIAALPFLTRSGLPRHTDLELHVFRAAEYGDVLRDGVLYPRWAPDFYYGYGYPIFNYYAPFTYALASLLAIPFGIVAGVKGVILLAFFLAAIGMYYFSRRHFGSIGGVIGSAAFVLSPYILFIDPLIRGDLAEFFALSLIPWLFLVFDRPAQLLGRTQAYRALVLGILILSHNLTALFALGILTAYLLWHGLTIDAPRRWIADLTAVVLALLLTSIFWLPFITERSAIRLDVAGPGHFDYHSHFIPLSMLFSPSPAIDLGATTPKFIYNLGIVQWLLIIPAALLAIRKRADSSGKISLLFIFVSALTVFLITPHSQFIWDLIPASAYIQFPWRLLGPVSFTLAVCAAFVTHRVSLITSHASRITRHLSLITNYLSLIILSALLLAALPTMYPPLWDPNFGDTSPRGMIDFELSGVALGTTSTGDFQPIQIGRVPGPTQSLLDSYATGLLDKFDHASLPAGATVQVEQHSVIFDRFAINTPTAFQARVLTFYFLGWHVAIDGAEVPIKPADQDGFITFAVPSGAHSIEVSLQLTTPQLSGTLISLASLLTLIVVFIRRANVSTPIPEVSLTRLPAISPSLLLSLCILFLAGKVLIIDRCDSCFRFTSPIGQALGAQYKQSAHFGGHIDLLGYDLPSTSVEAGQVLPLTLYWHATAPVPVNYQVFAHLTQPATVLWGQSDKLNPGDFPTTRWPLNKFVWDDHSLRVLPGTPPGDYRISIGLYTLDNGQRVTIFDDNGQIAGDNVILDQVIHVTLPSMSPSIESLKMDGELERSAGGVKLIGWSIESKELSTPNFIRLTLFWASDLEMPVARSVRVEMIDQSGSVVQSIMDVVPEYKRSWPMRAQYPFWLPPDFPGGIYLLRANLLGDGAKPIDANDVITVKVRKP